MCVCVCVCVCVCACVRVCVCVAKPVAVELRCHATAHILVIGKAQFRRAMLSCDSSCSFSSIQTVHVFTAIYFVSAMQYYHGIYVLTKWTDSC